MHSGWAHARLKLPEATAAYETAGDTDAVKQLFSFAHIHTHTHTHIHTHTHTYTHTFVFGHMHIYRYPEAAAAYETAGDMDAVVRLALEKLRMPQRAYAVRKNYLFIYSSTQMLRTEMHDVCTHTHTHAHIYAHRHAHMHTHAHTHSHTHKHARASCISLGVLHKCACTGMHECTHTQVCWSAFNMHTQSYAHTRTYMCSHTHTPTQTHTNTHTHTHTHMYRWCARHAVLRQLRTLQSTACRAKTLRCVSLTLRVYVCVCTCV